MTQTRKDRKQKRAVLAFFEEKDGDSRFIFEIIEQDDKTALKIKAINVAGDELRVCYQGTWTEEQFPALRDKLNEAVGNKKDGNRIEMFNHQFPAKFLSEALAAIEKNLTLKQATLKAQAEVSTSKRLRTGSKWTKEEVAQLILEFKDGKTIQEIAELHKRKENGIRFRLVKHGLLEDAEIQKQLEKVSRIGKRWTDEEDCQLKEEVAQGKTIQEIAELHKRKERGIWVRLLEKKLVGEPESIKEKQG